MLPSKTIDVMLSFDTTGSMYPCLTQVRRYASELVGRLFKDIPGIRIGILAHGDYCDEGDTYVTKMLDLSADKGKIVHFINHVEPTGGGDSPECYEFVLNQIRSADWKSGRTKAFVLIGDDVPHEKGYSCRGSKTLGESLKLDWRNELGLLHEAGIKVYAVQALGRGHATKFYKAVAERTKGYHLSLNQFSDVYKLIMSICYKEDSDKALESYEDELIVNGKMSRGVDTFIGSLLGRLKSKKFTTDMGELGAVPGGRFQVIGVDEDTPIKEFVESQGLSFKKGRGFYEFTKRKKATIIQDYKEVILMDDKTGDLFNGDKAREIAGIPVGVTTKLQPSRVDGYTVFVQSTSVNRVLQSGTRFLYEVEDWDR